MTYGKEIPQSGEHWAHYKGGKYLIICSPAFIESTHERVVVYRKLGSINDRFWVRPTTEFFDQVEVEGKTVQRFTKLGQLDLL